MAGAFGVLFANIFLYGDALSASDEEVREDARALQRVRDVRVSDHTPHRRSSCREPLTAQFDAGGVTDDGFELVHLVEDNHFALVDRRRRHPDSTSTSEVELDCGGFVCQSPHQR